MNDAFVLHSRPFRNTSLLMDLFTRSQGRVSVIARGVKKNKQTNMGLYQVFTPVTVTYQGRSELQTLVSIEPRGNPYLLNGKKLLSGLYLNELLMRLLERFDMYTAVFDCYELTLQALTSTSKIEPVLRHFELELLNELGYALQLDREAKSGNLVELSSYYRYVAEDGFMKIQGNHESSPANSLFLGKQLLAIHEKLFDDQDTLKSAKRLLRLALQPLLGNKPLKSRELFV